MNISKEIRKKISSLAKHLPVKFYNDHSILQVEHIGNDTNLKRIRREVNHRKALEKAYIKFGEIGLSKYCEMINKEKEVPV